VDQVSIFSVISIASHASIADTMPMTGAVHLR